MGRLRATIRLFALCAVTCALSALLLAGLIPLIPFRRARGRWRGFILRRGAKAIAALLNLKVTAVGTRPPSPFFLAANHLSYVDIIVLATQANCRFIAKKDVSAWPLIGLLCRGVGTIFIDRENRRDLVRVNRAVGQALAAGGGVVLFPEGTSSQGATVLPFKPGLLELAARAGLAVSYAALSYSVPGDQTPAHLSVCWWGDMTFVKHLASLLRLGAIEATLVFGREPIRATDRKQLARELHAAIEREFTPVVNLEEEWSAVTR
ncbi:MAG TPA: lysophospholipid acyltransferase family protein [Blastocatellia bacterium]|nr:lysophospholipid acyltransferase family protein [Blastocatellia bacterium]